MAAIGDKSIRKEFPDTPKIIISVVTVSDQSH